MRTFSVVPLRPTRPRRPLRLVARLAPVTPLRLLVFLATLGAFGSTAHAGSDVGLVVGGESWMQPQLTAQIEGWLSQHGHGLVKLPPDALDAIKQCFASRDLPCARGVVDKLPRPASVIYAGIEARNATGAAPDVTLVAYRLDKGRDTVGQQRQTCPRCNDQSLRSTADDVLKKLVGGDDPGHVKLKSAPPGATIKIDGQAIGVAPLDWDLTPGKHTIEMEKSGLKPASREVVVTSNKSDLVVISLTADGAEPRDETPFTVPRWISLPAVVGGGAAIVAGGVLIKIDQDRGPFQPPTIRNTAPLGVGLVIGGAVVGGLGAYFLLFRSPATASAPVAAFTGDSAYIGWAGRF